MSDMPTATREIDEQIANQLERLRATVQRAAAAGGGDDARMGILRLLDQLLQQPAHAACELLRRGPRTP